MVCQAHCKPLCTRPAEPRWPTHAREVALTARAPSGSVDSTTFHSLVGRGTGDRVPLVAASLGASFEASLDTSAAAPASPSPVVAMVAVWKGTVELARPAAWQCTTCSTRHWLCQSDQRGVPASWAMVLQATVLLSVAVCTAGPAMHMLACTAHNRSSCPGHTREDGAAGRLSRTCATRMQEHAAQCGRMVRWVHKGCEGEALTTCPTPVSGEEV